MAGASVEWVCADAVQTPFRAGSFTSCRCSTQRCPRPPARPLCECCSTRYALAGLLLVVYHDLDADHREHMKSEGVHPADYVGADDLDRLLSDDFTVELCAVEPRIDPPLGTPHVADVVLRTRHR